MWAFCTQIATASQPHTSQSGRPAIPRSVIYPKTAAGCLIPVGNGTFLAAGNSKLHPLERFRFTGGNGKRLTVHHEATMHGRV